MGLSASLFKQQTGSRSPSPSTVTHVPRSTLPSSRTEVGGKVDICAIIIERMNKFIRQTSFYFVTICSKQTAGGEEGLLVCELEKREPRGYYLLPYSVATKRRGRKKSDHTSQT